MIAPDNLRWLRIIEEMPDAGIIPGQNQLPIARIPNSKRPISEKLCQAVCSPSLEGSLHNGDIGVVIQEVIVNLCYQVVSIVEPTIPGHYFSRVRDMWLMLETGFRCSVERAVQQTDGMVEISCLAVRTILSERVANLDEGVSVDRFPIEVPDPRLDAHTQFLLNNVPKPRRFFG